MGFKQILNENLYHGSPAKFDRFDMRKVGTGTEVNKYGFGLYFADNSEDAINYAREATPKGRQKEGMYLYEVRVAYFRDFPEWDDEIDDNLHRGAVEWMQDNGLEDTAELMEREYEDYGDRWSLDTLYSVLESDLGSQKKASAAMVEMGVDGVKISKSPWVRGKIYVVYNVDLIKVLNKEKFA